MNAELSPPVLNAPAWKFAREDITIIIPRPDPLVLVAGGLALGWLTFTIPVLVELSALDVLFH